MDSVTKGGIEITRFDYVADTMGALSPQTVTWLFSGALVTKPAPFTVSDLPPTNEVLTLEPAALVGSALQLTVTVGGDATANP